MERVEELVTQHNRCGGKLWAPWCCTLYRLYRGWCSQARHIPTEVGGSQPPLLLAFLNLKQALPILCRNVLEMTCAKGEEKDYMVFPAEWNYGDLGAAPPYSGHASPRHRVARLSSARLAQNHDCSQASNQEGAALERQQKAVGYCPVLSAVNHRKGETEREGEKGRESRGPSSS